jgi:hypothetical protein
MSGVEGKADITAVLPVDELPGDANSLADLANASLEHECDAELLRGLLNADGSVFVSKGGVAGDNVKPGMSSSIEPSLGRQWPDFGCRRHFGTFYFFGFVSSFLDDLIQR